MLPAGCFSRACGVAMQRLERRQALFGHKRHAVQAKAVYSRRKALHWLGCGNTGIRTKSEGCTSVEQASKRIGGFGSSLAQ